MHETLIQCTGRPSQPDTACSTHRDTTVIDVLSIVIQQCHHRLALKETALIQLRESLLKAKTEVQQAELDVTHECEFNYVSLWEGDHVFL